MHYIGNFFKFICFSIVLYILEKATRNRRLVRVNIGPRSLVDDCGLRPHVSRPCHGAAVVVSEDSRYTFNFNFHIPADLFPHAFSRYLTQCTRYLFIYKYIIVNYSIIMSKNITNNLK